MLSKNTSGAKRNSLLLLVLITAAFYVLNVFTPLALDDYAYRFIFSREGPERDRFIQSWLDIIVSQYNHYFAWNGRSVVHAIVQAFCGIIGKATFNVVNALAISLFTILLCRVGNTGKLNGTRVLIAFALAMLLPSIGATFLWMTGAVNYLWSATAAVAFLLMFEARRDKPLSRISALYFFAALLCGWTHEGIVFPLCVGLGLYVLSTPLHST
ncbi:MAG: hypothetical protein IJ729_05640, partial [Alloprevotella sp.]|nr:hypothetical protein [Alloprevotella sp.]